MSVPATQRRPEWLRIRLRTTEEFAEVRRMMDGLKLATVCEEARCPNIYECWSNRTATFMILGDVCTRRCGFCAVTSGLPSRLPDPDEPRRVAEAVRDLGLAHAVITSVDRDDLPDGGARHFARVIEAIHEMNPGGAVEVLTPDFKGVPEALSIVLAARPEVFSHNMETVRRLYRKARPGSRYEGSLDLLRAAARARDKARGERAVPTRRAGTDPDNDHPASGGSSIFHGPVPEPRSSSSSRSVGKVQFTGEQTTSRSHVEEAGSGENGQRQAALEPADENRPTSPPHRLRVKTGLMVGLGETDEELKETFRDIRAAGVEVLTLGQYLQPTKEHLPVERFVTPKEFAAHREYALSLGFLHVVAGPLVRSSYRAHEHRPDAQPLHRT